MKEEEKAEADEKSLSSIPQARKKSRKNPTNAGTLTTKSRPKNAKVKKEEPQVDDNDHDHFDTPIMVKGSSGSRPKVAKVKKEEGKDDDDDHRSISKKNFDSKEMNKKKNIKEEEKKKKKKKKKKKGSVVSEQNGKKRERKVYELPGQKRDPPGERDPLRIFYETLYKQLPNSEMAQIWMMESGLLSKEEAKKVYEKKQKKNQQKLSSLMKAVVTTKETHSVTIVKKKTPSSSVSSTKKKTIESKLEIKQSKKRKIADRSSGEFSDK
ncbi:hypothetical protein P3X46_002021 [Hevea brasiliensis]|uniref:Uncharacterized protein n=1 Tax=Hevea brasiliensis TaxID=3981 RepID=A0ABQ9N2T1_HEVBR|nr:protein PXR1 isoform X2 [Hevea brasiliensis]KAJ9186449.1 hypothetical protein P3X46_002021 [Hevea brasiliensis]